MPMLIVLHRDTEYSACIADIWAEYLTDQGVEIRWVDLLSHNALGQVLGCDGVMWRWGHKPTDKLAAYRILHSTEVYLGIPVFPDHRTCWHYDEKLSQYYLLKAAGIPTPKTWVYWEKEKALEWAHETGYPKVFKLSAGASGMNVVKVLTSTEATNLIHRMFGPGIYGGQIEPDSNMRTLPLWKRPRAMARRWKSALKYVMSGEPPQMPGTRWRLEKGYAYFQEFIPHEYETRAYVIEDSAWGYKKFPPPDDFRASGSLDRGGSIDTNHANIDTKIIRMAFELSDRLGFESMKYDFILKDGEPVVSELDCAVGRGRRIILPGTWNRNLEWRDGLKPLAEGQVEVFLKRV